MGVFRVQRTPNRQLVETRTFRMARKNSVLVRGEQKLSVVRSEVCEPRRSGEAAQNYILPLEVSCRYKVGFHSWYATISYPKGTLEVREKR